MSSPSPPAQEGVTRGRAASRRLVDIRAPTSPHATVDDDEGQVAGLRQQIRDLEQERYARSVQHKEDYEAVQQRLTRVEVALEALIMDGTALTAQIAKMSDAVLGNAPIEVVRAYVSSLRPSIRQWKPSPCPNVACKRTLPQQFAVCPFCGADLQISSTAARAGSRSPVPAQDAHSPAHRGTGSPVPLSSRPGAESGSAPPAGAPRCGTCRAWLRPGREVGAGDSVDCHVCGRTTTIGESEPDPAGGRCGSAGPSPRSGAPGGGRGGDRGSATPPPIRPQTGTPAGLRHASTAPIEVPDATISQLEEMGFSHSAMLAAVGAGVDGKDVGAMVAWLAEHGAAFGGPGSATCSGGASPQASGGGSSPPGGAAASGRPFDKIASSSDGGRAGGRATTPPTAPTTTPPIAAGASPSSGGGGAAARPPGGRGASRTSSPGVGAVKALAAGSATAGTGDGGAGGAAGGWTDDAAMVPMGGSKGGAVPTQPPPTVPRLAPVTTAFDTIYAERCTPDGAAGGGDGGGEAAVPAPGDESGGDDADDIVIKGSGAGRSGGVDATARLVPQPPPGGGGGDASPSPAPNGKLASRASPSPPPGRSLSPSAGGGEAEGVAVDGREGAEGTVATKALPTRAAVEGAFVSACLRDDASAWRVVKGVAESTIPTGDTGGSSPTVAQATDLVLAGITAALRAVRLAVGDAGVGPTSAARFMKVVEVVVCADDSGPLARKLTADKWLERYQRLITDTSSVDKDGVVSKAVASTLAAMGVDAGE